MHAMSYVLPYRSARQASSELVEYVNALTLLVEVILVDGSPEAAYRAFQAHCVPAVRHIRPDAQLANLGNGKVRGVLTGLRFASHEVVIVADDDVRYTPANLEEMAAALETADVIRPQNFFDPLPWHARIDTARTLINRVTGGDWPGTLGVRRSTLWRTDGYDGNVLFENLELVRTVKAAGGKERCIQDLFVRRLPSDTRHFWSQRVRQAYDEFARPARLATVLAIVPLIVIASAAHHGVAALIAFTVMPIAIAELGRQRDHGVRAFPFSASLCAPVWVLERAVCAWIAVGARLTGGIPYGGRRLKTAAHSTAVLARRWADQ